MSVDELRFATRLIEIDSSSPAGVLEAIDTVETELEANGIAVERRAPLGRPCLLATVGSGPVRIILHGHADVVPAAPELFRPRIDGDLLHGRGALDMKAALAALVAATIDARDIVGCEVQLVVVPDEERADPRQSCTEELVRDGLRADLVICGEPTDLTVGVTAKGALMLRASLAGRGAHGSTPELGRNAILEGVAMFNRIASLPFMNEARPPFDRASANLGRIVGGDAINKVADRCAMHIDVRYLPGQDPDDVLDQLASLGDWVIDPLLRIPPLDVSPNAPLVRALRSAAARNGGDERPSSRDGTSDGVAFAQVGVPAVEFGPHGRGHHGPDEHVSISSLRAYRSALGDFLHQAAAMGVAAEEVPAA